MRVSRDNARTIKENTAGLPPTERLRVLKDVWSPQLECRRDIFVHLPESYGRSAKRYPVIYMQDGQDLFSRQPAQEDGKGVRGAFEVDGAPRGRSRREPWEVDWDEEDPRERRRSARPGSDNRRSGGGTDNRGSSTLPAGADGCWGADETLEALEPEGIEAIVVGIPHLPHRRMEEYGPFRDAGCGGGDGDRYVDFVAGTLRSIVDREFRTMRHRRSTGIMGASMGGLISLYAGFSRPEVFGMVGAMSPSLWFADGAVLPFISQARPIQGRIYLDVGTEEGGAKCAKGLAVDQQPGPRGDTRRLYGLLRDKGYTPGRDLLFVEERGGRHEAAAWGRRLPDALRFLLAD